MKIAAGKGTASAESKVKEYFMHQDCPFILFIISFAVQNLLN